MQKPSFTYMGRASELIPVRSMVTISGDSEALIEHCKRILECSDIRCSVTAGSFTVDIWGSDLSLTSFANGSVSVNGKIRSVSVERRCSSNDKEDGGK